MTVHLDIAIGPVQGFLAQARRTRDLWSGSYLLSFLSGHAMGGAEGAGGRVVRPVVRDDALYRWISGRGCGEPPSIGSLPNRFTVEVDGDAVRVAKAARIALEAAWERVCAAVWAKFVAHTCQHGDGTQAIWNRQVPAFWEVMWTAGPAGDGLLSRRKHWRYHWPPDEPGDKCTVMHDLQELSGHGRSTGRAGRDAQDRFWAHLRKQVGKLDLRDNERLCAVMLVKRLFPRVSGDALGWATETTRWPSTLHIAARPWLRRVEAAAPRQARDYAAEVKRLAPTGVLSELRPPGLGPSDNGAGEFHRLDANWFHCEAVGNERLCPIEADAGDNVRGTLGKALQAIYAAECRDGQQLGSPASFYALLLADGDRLGKLVSALGGERVGEALATFTSGVPGVVRSYNGKTVYAGGDDVLAMLPVPDALGGAAELAESYRAAFDGVSEATLSAAVVFAHIRYPLGAAIREAHRLLDDVAKEENGRDSLAVAVLKPGGLSAQWVTTWKRPGANGASGSSVALIEALLDRFGNETSEPGLVSALIYRIRELLVRLGGLDSWRPGAWISVPEGVDPHVVLRAEIDHSLAVSGDESTEGRAGEMTDMVLSLLQRASGTGEEEKAAGASGIGVDALLLSRFLARADQGEDEA